MTILILDGDLIGDALAELGEEELVIVIDPSADRLDELEERFPDPRISWLIGDGVVVPLPDSSVDKVLGEASESELRRVLRA